VSVPPPPGARAVVLDSTAILALGAGNQWLSRLIGAAAARTDTYVYAPALCLAAAVADRPRIGDHIGGLAAIDVLDLTYNGASTTGALIAGGTSWQQAHAVAAARPSMEWPTGLPVATTTPGAYAGHDGLDLIDLG
jgi:hypothetical protein